jgi:type I restriction enzyme S subunit
MEVSVKKSKEKNLYRPYFPDKWERKILFDIADWKNGLAFRDISFSDDGVPIIKIAELKNGITGQTKFTNQIFDDVVFLTKNDMVFSWSGNPETSIDVFWYNLPDGWLNQHIFKVTAKEEVDEDFFFYILKYLKPNFTRIASNKQTTGLGHVTISDLKQINVRIPPIPIQRAIAATLSCLDDKIALNSRINANLEAQAQAIFKSWFVDFEPFKGGKFVDSELGRIPKGWRVGTLNEIIELYDSKRLPLSNREREKMQKKYPYYGAASLIDYVDDYLFDGIFILFGEDGTVITDTGYPVLQYVWGKFWVNNHAHIMKATNGFSDESLYVLLSNTYIQNLVTGAVQPKINQANLRSIPTIIPTYNIIEKYNHLLEPIFGLKRYNLEQSNRLAAIRDTLLPKLMSGEIEVK